MISIFTTCTNPLQRGDLYHEALKCYRDLADEVVVVNGGGQVTRFLSIKYINRVWPREFLWPLIGKQFQRGYEACSGDWVIHMDLDFIFHEKDFGKIRQAIKDYPDAPAISFYKWQFILPDRYNLKSRLPLAVNKGKFDKRIKFNGGGDLCQPTLDGNEFNLDEIPQAKVPFYNYEKILKTEDQIVDDQGRMERAYYAHFGKYQLAEDDTELSAYKGWLKMQYGRLQKPHKHISLKDHPIYMQDTIKNLKSNQWGYSGFGYEVNDYAQSIMFS